MGMGRVLASSGNIGTALVLSGVYLYSRMQSGAELPAADAKRSPRSSLAASALARRQMKFRMRDGARVRCRIADAGCLLSVNIDRDYDIPGVAWSSLRTIVDIGAHVGAFTVWAARRAPDARILAIEPNPESFSQLLRNIEDNSLLQRVTAVNAAVGPYEGTGQLEMLAHSLGSRLSRTGTGEVTVRVKTIASLLSEAGMPKVDLMKMDCEGMEFEIFESMSPEQMEGIRTIGCEYHSGRDRDVSELDAVLGAAGFKVTRPNAPVGVIWATR